MTTAESLVKQANQMYEMRRALRALFGEKYDVTVSPYGRVIRHVAKERGIGELEAAIAMCREMKAVDPDPVITMCLMAAAVDIVEPAH